MKEFKSFYKTVGGNEGNKCNYPTRLDTYGCGCTHDCSYCYAKSLLDFRKLWNAQSPSVADVDKVLRKIDKIESGSVIRLGGMTDCFQAIERKYGVTKEAIKKMNEKGIHYLIVTKSDLVSEYIDIMDRDLAHIQVSVTTTDDRLSLTYEKAPVPSKRIQAIEKLYKAGYDVQLRLSPFIPQYVDMNIINDVKCDKILVEFLRVNSWIMKWFDIDYSEYTVKHAGYRHLPLEKKIEYLGKITGFNGISVCEDVDEHYNYWRDNVNSNVSDCCNLNLSKSTVAVK